MDFPDAGKKAGKIRKIGVAFGIRPLVQLGRKALAPAAVAALLAGCMSSHKVPLDEWGGMQNCHFAHVAKKDFETALRRVFNAGHPKAYGLRPEEGGALVEQHWAIDAVFREGGGTERWRVEYAPAGDGIDGRADVEHAGGAGAAPERRGLVDSGNEAMYRLLWLRVAYVLGGRSGWPRCETVTEAGGRDALAPHQSAGLCGTGASDVPPPKLNRW